MPSLIAVLTFALALARNLSLVRNGFDGLYGQDPYAYLDYARRMVMLFREGTPLGKLYYPLGFPLLAAVGVALGGAAGAQIMVMISGTALVAIGGLVASESARLFGWDQRAAFLAQIGASAALIASPQIAQSSIVIMSDIPALLWALVSGWALIRYARLEKTRYLIVAAAFLAFAVMTRWNYAILAASFGVCLILHWRGVRWKAVALLLTVGTLCYMPQLLMNTLDPSLLGDSTLLWNPANLTRNAFTSSDGLVRYAELNAAFYAIPITSRDYLSPWLLPLIAVGAFVMFRNPKVIVLIGGWAILQYVFLAGLPVQNMRYPLAIFAPLAVLVGIGAGWLAGRSRLLLVIGVGLLCAGLVQSVGNTDDLLARFLPIKAREQETLAWLHTLIPESGASIFCLEICLPMDEYTPWTPIQVFYETAETLGRRADSGPIYAVLDVATLETQWKGRAPEGAYRWLKDNRTLELVGERPPYTLIRVRTP